MIGVLAASLLGQTCVAQQVAYAPVQYGQTYAQNYVEKTFFVAVEDPASYYAGLVGTQQRQAERQQQAQQVQSSTDAKIDRLAAIVESLQRKLEAKPNEQPQSLLPPKPAPANAPQVLPAEAVPPPPTISQAATGASHPGLASLTKSCAGCHQGAATEGGGVQIFDEKGRFTAVGRDELERIELAITSGRMPKKPAKPLTLKDAIAAHDFLVEQASGLALNARNLPRKIR